ncbi:MAG: hypothetical protein JKY51_05035, partial [Opitutaceae bacterium]|nr:hypothetical protein [Opitutaceae bacterium]
MPDYQSNPLSRVEYDTKNPHVGGDHAPTEQARAPNAHGSANEGGHH